MIAVSFTSQRTKTTDFCLCCLVFAQYQGWQFWTMWQSLSVVFFLDLFCCCCCCSKRDRVLEHSFFHFYVFILLFFFSFMHSFSGEKQRARNLSLICQSSCVAHHQALLVPSPTHWCFTARGKLRPMSRATLS